MSWDDMFGHFKAVYKTIEKQNHKTEQRQISPQGKLPGLETLGQTILRVTVFIGVEWL